MVSPLRLNRVLVPLTEHMLTTSISLPLEMLQAAMTYSQLQRQDGKTEIRFCAESLTSVQSMSGILLTPDSTLEESGQADLVLVPALWRNPMPVVRNAHVLVQWLKQQHANGALFCVAGTGIAFMAEAGLLDGQPAATHWYYLDRLKKHYRKVDFKPNHLITRSGRIYCAGSVNSVADLMVHIIGLAMGESVAHRVEQQFSHEIRRPFEQTHYAEDHTTVHRDEVIVRLQDWLQNHFSEEIGQEQLVVQSGLTKRTLHRRFKEATGISPSAYLQKLRLSQSTELLKSTDLSVSEIALRCGYGDPDYYSRLFKKHYQLSPSDFRRSVRGKLFHLSDRL